MHRPKLWKACGRAAGILAELEGRGLVNTEYPTEMPASPHLRIRTIPWGKAYSRPALAQDRLTGFESFHVRRAWAFHRAAPMRHKGECAQVQACNC